MVGTFWSRMSHGDRMLEDIELLVLEGQGKPLQGRNTSIRLGLLKVGPSFVNSLDTQSMTKTKSLINTQNVSRDLES